MQSKKRPLNTSRSKPQNPKIRLLKLSLYRVSLPDPPDTLMLGAASRDDLNMLAATLEHHSRMLVRLRTDLNKTVSRRHLWVLGAISLVLIAGAFFLDPETVVMAIEKLAPKSGPPPQ